MEDYHHSFGFEINRNFASSVRVSCLASHGQVGRCDKVGIAKKTYVDEQLVISYEMEVRTARE